MRRSRLFIALLIIAAVSAFFALDLGRFFDFAALKAQQHRLDAYFTHEPLKTALIYFGVYVAVAGLSLPGAAVMTVAGGAVFGILWGTLLVSFASTIGATVAFLLARFIFRDAVRARYGERLRRIDDGVRRDGAFYLFTLRLVPLFPFVIINLLMGLTALPTRVYFLVSQIGMLPGTIVYVNAGTQLARLDSLGGILSPPLIASFTLLGIFPLLARKFVSTLKARRALGGYRRPRRFDRNLIVIGAGSAGLVAAYIAAALRARVSLIEKERMGGDCLNTGCVPSKALIRSARFIADCRRARDFGVRRAELDFEFADIMERVRRVIAAVAPHDSVERYTGLGVECIRGEARISSPYSVEVGGRELSTRAIIVAAGGRPLVPPIPGIEAVSCYTSDTVWSMSELPRRLLVLGGGPIGCELAQCFARFGSQVTLVEMAGRLLVREEPEASRLLEQQFQQEGIELLLNHRAVRFDAGGSRRVLSCESLLADGGAREVEFDAVLLAAGRSANTRGYGLEELGIALTPQGTIEVNEYLQTRVPTIYACGDVTGPYQFTHTASHQAWYAAVNAAFSFLWKFPVDYSVIPWATFTEPEIARVGLSEAEAQRAGIDFEVTCYPIADLDRAIADEAASGFVKLVTRRGRDRVLGATIAGAHAGELITEFISAMRHGIGLNKLLGTIHIYPTWAEANKYAAGNWKRAHAPEGLLRVIERIHAWRRG